MKNPKRKGTNDSYHDFFFQKLNYLRLWDIVWVVSDHELSDADPEHKYVQEPIDDWWTQEDQVKYDEPCVLEHHFERAVCVSIHLEDYIEQELLEDECTNYQVIHLAFKPLTDD